MEFRAGHTGVCPHCKTGVRFEGARVTFLNRECDASTLNISFVSGSSCYLHGCSCPICGEPIVSISYVTGRGKQQRSGPGMLFPIGSQRPLPAEVRSASPDFAADFSEAVAVLPTSRKASAALSRRCLQLVLVSAGGAKKRDLADQIEEVLPNLPSELALNVDAIRHVGNFAAHPMKSTNSGAIADVEDGEAEWLLDVLEELADFYFVAPTQAANKRQALNQKLADLGKPPLKAP